LPRRYAFSRADKKHISIFCVAHRQARLAPAPVNWPNRFAVSFQRAQVSHGQFTSFSARQKFFGWSAACSMRSIIKSLEGGKHEKTNRHPTIVALLIAALLLPALAEAMTRRGIEWEKGDKDHDLLSM